MLRPTLERILSDYPAALGEAFAGNPTVSFIRNQAPLALAEALPPSLATFRCVGSGGAGNFATVPWLAVFDPLVTNSATQGYYVVYLFNKESQSVYLSLNQGATALRAEFGSQAPQVLHERANLMALRLPDYVANFDTASISLNSTRELPRDYEAGHAFGRHYFLESLPTEAELRADLQQIVLAYDALTHRGGLSASVEEDEDASGPHGSTLTIIEKRKYKFHKRIERNGAGARLAKKLHGSTCQACCFNFEQQYGEMGTDFIEAHHLKQLSTLEEGVAVTYNLATDFAVLCANCHRMIHKMDDVSDLPGFKLLIRSTFCS